VSDHLILFQGRRKRAGVWPLRIPNADHGVRPFLLVFRTIGLSLLALKRERVPPDTRIFQHIAGCAPHRRRCGGQRLLPAKRLPTLGPL
jgi:hypothetical protein